MLNLLFISDSPKTAYIKKELQPRLKVIIDVVTDFDHGLKDVFEKRPATVCIQDQIGGVSGESVARHIQMLLGSGAPTFILLHAANDKARVINGIFEHLIDVSLSNDVLIENILGTLKLLLGSQWDTLYIPPKEAPAPARPSVDVSEVSREDAEKLVEDFASTPEPAAIAVVEDPPPLTLEQVIAAKKMSRAAQTESRQVPETGSVPVPPVAVQSSNEETVELLLAEVKKAERDGRPSSPPSDTTGESKAAPTVSPKTEKTAEKRGAPDGAEAPAPLETASRKTPAKKTVDPAPGKTGQKSDPMPPAPQPVPSAEEFRVSQDYTPLDEPIPEDLLLAFEENYRSESTFMRRKYIIALVCIMCVAGGWYAFSQNPQIVSMLKEKLLPSSGAKQAPVKPVVAPAPQKPVLPPAPPPVAVPTLPSFIPKDGLDSAYAQNKPGWNRYVGKQYDFRVFTVSGRIQAIQVLAVNGSVPEAFINSVLQEFAGSPTYKIESRSTKDGVRVENGKILNKGDVIFYRKNGSVKAFVVSVN